eukprot:g7719.t1
MVLPTAEGAGGAEGAEGVDAERSYLTASGELAEAAPGFSKASYLTSGYASGHPLYRKRGFQWWHAHVLWETVRRPPPATRQSLAAFVRAAFDVRAGAGAVVGAAKPAAASGEGGGEVASCVAVHVRHGDSCSDMLQPRKRCFALRQYMAAVRRLLRRYGPRRHVYIGTDDRGVLAEAATGVRPGGTYEDLALRWQAYEHHDAYGYTHGGEDGSRQQQHGPDGRPVDIDGNDRINTPQVALEMHRDVWAMSHCDLFVGTLSSSVAWVVLDLMTARHGRFPPFIGLEPGVGLGDPSFRGKFQHVGFPDDGAGSFQSWLHDARPAKVEGL